MSYPYSKNLITFYNATICPFAQRVAWSLKEAGVEHHTEYVDLFNKPAWLAAVNPASKVPSLRLTDGTVLVESLPTARYIADKYPESKLVPTEALEKYKINLFIDTYADKIINLAYQLIKSKGQAEKQTSVDEIHAHLRRLNDFLLEHSPHGPYLLGEAFSIAEIGTITFIQRMQVVFKLLNMNFDGFEGIERFYQWKNAAMSRPTYISTVAEYEEMAKYFAQLIPK